MCYAVIAEVKEAAKEESYQLKATKGSAANSNSAAVAEGTKEKAGEHESPSAVANSAVTKTAEVLSSYILYMYCLPCSVPAYKI